jgi:hypothetical protein
LHVGLLPRPPNGHVVGSRPATCTFRTMLNSPGSSSKLSIDQGSVGWSVPSKELAVRCTYRPSAPAFATGPARARATPCHQPLTEIRAMRVSSLPLHEQRSARAPGGPDSEGDRVSQRSAGRTFLEKAWLPLVAVIAVALGALCMWKVHQASAPGPVLAVNGPQAPEEFVPKQLTYELFGSLGDGGMLDYIDIDGPSAPGRSHVVALVAHGDDHAHRRFRQYLGAGPRGSGRLPDVGQRRCPR